MDGELLSSFAPAVHLTSVSLSGIDQWLSGPSAVTGLLSTCHMLKYVCCLSQISNISLKCVQAEVLQ